MYCQTLCSIDQMNSKYCTYNTVSIKLHQIKNEPHWSVQPRPYTLTHLPHSSRRKPMEMLSQGWSHDIIKLQSSIVQPSIASDFPHTPGHVTGGEVCSWNISGLFSPLLAEKKKEEIWRTGFLPVQWTAECLVRRHMGGIRRRRVLFPYPAWPSCTYTEDRWRAAMSFPLLIFLFLLSSAAFFVFSHPTIFLVLKDYMQAALHYWWQLLGLYATSLGAFYRWEMGDSVYV